MRWYRVLDPIVPRKRLILLHQLDFLIFAAARAMHPLAETGILDASQRAALHRKEKLMLIRNGEVDSNVPPEESIDLGTLYSVSNKQYIISPAFYFVHTP